MTMHAETAALTGLSAPEGRSWRSVVASLARRGGALLRTGAGTQTIAGAGVRAFSAGGEDLILRQMFWGRRQGWYVDVGAHHPWISSNTALFYHLGWRGMNIDATPGSMAAFKTARPHDINLELAISDQSGPLTFHRFNRPALNGFDPRHDLTGRGDNEYYIVGTCTVHARPLADVLDEHLPRDQTIDFLDIDVEGHDLPVLRSNDWRRYRPTVVLAESLGRDLVAPETCPVFVFMKQQHYKLLAKTLSTWVFQDTQTA